MERQRPSRRTTLAPPRRIGGPRTPHAVPRAKNTSCRQTTLTPRSSASRTNAADRAPHSERPSTGGPHPKGSLCRRGFRPASAAWNSYAYRACPSSTAWSQHRFHDSMANMLLAIPRMVYSTKKRACHLIGATIGRRRRNAVGMTKHLHPDGVTPLCQPLAPCPKPWLLHSSGRSSFVQATSTRCGPLSPPTGGSRRHPRRQTAD